MALCYTQFFFNPLTNAYGTGEAFLHFFLQIAEASFLTTIVTGAMAER